MYSARLTGNDANYHSTVCTKDEQNDAWNFFPCTTVEGKSKVRFDGICMIVRMASDVLHENVAHVC